MLGQPYFIKHYDKNKKLNYMEAIRTLTNYKMGIGWELIKL